MLSVGYIEQSSIDNRSFHFTHKYLLPLTVTQAMSWWLVSSPDQIPWLYQTFQVTIYAAQIVPHCSSDNSWNACYFMTFCVSKSINTRGNWPYARSHLPRLFLYSPTFPGFPAEWPPWMHKLRHNMLLVDKYREAEMKHVLWNAPTSTKLGVTHLFLG